MRKIVLLLILGFTNGNNLFGQINNTPYQYNPTDRILPKTPEQAAFQRYIDIPQGNHTGVHGFNIPIYNIEIDGFLFPISINYNGGGIKVDEIASNIGLGWSLNIGSISLSQEIRGNDDLLSTKLKNIQDPNLFDPNGANKTTADLMFSSNVQNNGGIEQNPDYFSYSLLNNSGKFIFDSNDKIHTIPYDDVKIKYSDNFVLTDKKGIQYFFVRHFQGTNVFPAGGNNLGDLDIYSFRINKIIFSNGNSLEFKYKTITQKYISNHLMSRKRLFEGNRLYCNIAFDDFKSTTFANLENDYVIESIEYNTIPIVHFTYTEDRQDLIGGVKLDNIKVNDFFNQRKIIKNFKFNTSYFTSPQEITQFTKNEYETTLFKRLKLDSIEDLLANNSYSFEYNLGPSGTQFLPYRYSYKTDYWGMFNNQSNNLPFPEILTLDKDGNEIIEAGANKNPNLTYAQIGSLKKIKLPTGGFQEFEYELDSYKFDDYENRFIEQEQNENLYSNNSNFYNIIPIENNGVSYNFYYYTDSPPVSYDPLNNGLPTEDTYYLQLFKDNEPIGQRYFVSGNYNLSLESGSNYYLKMEKWDIGGKPKNNITNIRIALRWKKKEKYYIANKEVGSLRVKSITLNDSNNTSLIKREFYYNNFDNVNFSSGIYTGRLLDMKFFSREPGIELLNTGDFVFNCPYALGESCTYQNFSSNPAYNLNTSYGKSVVYENVTEKYIDLKSDNNNFIKQLNFSLPNKLGYPREDLLPLVVWPDNNYKGGELLEQKLYDSQNNLKQAIINSYTEDNYYNQFSSNSTYPSPYIGSSLALSIKAKLFKSQVGGVCDYYNVYDYNFSFITGGWRKLDRTTTTDFFPNGNIVTTTENKYSPIYNHLYPVSTTTTSSKGETLTSEYQYPSDLTSNYEQSPIMQEMVNRNMIATPVITKSKNGSTVLSEQRTLYKYFPTTNGNLILPEFVYAKKGATTTAVDRKITYNSYDNQGNLTQYTLENGLPVSIIWGYNNQYPVAKLEGVALSQISAATITTLNTKTTDADLLAAITTLRNTHKDAMVTGYLYKPLVGVTQIIQPNGVAEKYNYDASNRLQSIVNDKGETLKTFQYNYKP